MESKNYNQQRQSTFEKIENLDLSYFYRNKSFHYELNFAGTLFDLLENRTVEENYLSELKNDFLKNKNLNAYTASIFIELFLDLLQKAKEDEISESHIRKDIHEILKKIDLEKIIKKISKNTDVQLPENLFKSIQSLQIRKPKTAWISEKNLLRNIILKEFTTRNYGCLLPESTNENGRFFSCVFFDKRAKWSQFTMVKIARWFTIEDYENALAEAEEFILKNEQHETELIIVSLGFSEEVFAKFAMGEKGNLSDLSLKEVEFRADLQDAYENYSNRLIDNNEF